MHAIDKSEKGELEMPSMKNQEHNTVSRAPSLRLVAEKPGVSGLRTENGRSVYDQIVAGSYTMSAGFFVSVEKPVDAERRLLRVIRLALDADDTSVQHTMALLRREFNLDADDAAVWIYFQVMESLWSRLSDDARSRHFFRRQGAVTEH